LAFCDLYWRLFDVFFPLADRKKDSSLELLVHGLHLTKTDLKKMEKLTKINIHLHGESTTRGNLPFFLYFRPDRSSLSSLLDIPLQFKNMMINHLIVNFFSPVNSQRCLLPSNSARWKRPVLSSKTTRSTLTGKENHNDYQDPLACVLAINTSVNRRSWPTQKKKYKNR
jgi:hypothetical protein